MQKEEIFALIDQLTIDTERYNKFKDYTITFVNDKRCREGVLAFIDEVFNLPQLEGRDELALVLVTEKSHRNSTKAEQFIFSHPITIGYNEALKSARLELMQKVGEYIVDMSRRLDETDFVDKNERQVYLRRAIARLLTLFRRKNETVILQDQWCDIDPADIPYLTDTLDELVLEISDPKRIKVWSDQYGDWYGLDNETTLKSLRNYLDYLDSYLEH